MGNSCTSVSQTLVHAWQQQEWNKIKKQTKVRREAWVWNKSKASTKEKRSIHGLIYHNQNTIIINIICSYLVRDEKYNEIQLTKKNEFNNRKNDKSSTFPGYGWQDSGVAFIERKTCSQFIKNPNQPLCKIKDSFLINSTPFPKKSIVITKLKMQSPSSSL